MEKANALRKLSLLLTAIGFVGLGVTKAVRSVLGISEQQVMSTPFGSVVVLSLSALFVIGLMVIFPISLYLQRRAEGPVKRERMPWWGWFLIPFHMADPDWEVSPWIAWPIRGLLILLFLFLVFIIVGLLLFT